MKKFIALVLVLLCIGSTGFGFATLTAPQGGDNITFASNVSGVDVLLNNRPIGTMDANQFVYKVPRDDEEKIFTFKKDGYKTVTITLTKSFNSLFLLNFIVGGSLGSSTDSIFTKNIMQYSPTQYYVQLEKN